jgi:hypothetical protein
MKDDAKPAVSDTVRADVGRRTVKSRCPICDGVIDSVPIKYGVKAMMACPHCATMVVLDVEDAHNATHDGRRIRRTVDGIVMQERINKCKD